jgi:hypothetical protein
MWYHVTSRRTSFMRGIYRDKAGLTHWKDGSAKHALCGASLENADFLDPNVGKPPEEHSKPLRFIKCRECQRKFLESVLKIIRKHY